MNEEGGLVYREGYQCSWVRSVGHVVAHLSFYPV